MKAIYLFITILLVLTFASCSSSDNAMFDEVSSIDSMKKTYGIESVTSAVSDARQIPSVSLDEVQSVLETLRLNGVRSNNCIVESVNDASFGGVAEQNKRVVMQSEYVTKTSTESPLENFLLRVELKFNIDKGTVYYYGTDYKFNSNLFEWRANGLSIAPAKNRGEYIYEFESESFLYFRVKEQGDALMRVAIVFKGSYDFKTETGTYRFQLQKYSK